MPITIQITHCEPDSKRGVTVTPINEHGRICGEPQQVQPGERRMLTLDNACGYTVAEHPIDLVMLKARG